MRKVPFAAVLCVLLMSCGNSEREDKATGTDAPGGAQQSTGVSKSLAEMSADEKDAVRDSMMKQGLYDCCTKPGCTLCIGEQQECDCYIDIRRKDPICGECFEGYKAGKGKLKLMSIVELEEIRAKKGVK